MQILSRPVHLAAFIVTFDVGGFNWCFLSAGRFNIFASDSRFRQRKRNSRFNIYTSDSRFNVKPMSWEDISHTRFLAFSYIFTVKTGMDLDDMIKKINISKKIFKNSLKIYNMM